MESQQVKTGNKWAATLTRNRRGETLEVSGTIKAGPESIIYQLDEQIPPGTNPSILLLKISPVPSQGDQDVTIASFKKYFASNFPYTSVEITTRGNEKDDVPIKQV